MVPIQYGQIPEPCKMHLDRGLPDPHAPSGHAAGIHTSVQVARTRAEFKSHAIHGQFSNELISCIPETRTKFQSVRCDTAVCAPHQKSTSALRFAMEAAGSL